MRSLTTRDDSPCYSALHHQPSPCFTMKRGHLPSSHSATSHHLVTMPCCSWTALHLLCCLLLFAWRIVCCLLLLLCWLSVLFFICTDSWYLKPWRPAAIIVFYALCSTCFVYSTVYATVVWLRPNTMVKISLLSLWSLLVPKFKSVHTVRIPRTFKESAIRVL